MRKEYAAAGIRPVDVRTGAVIITGETARKQNANEVLEALASLAGDFVVATAGPDLESVLSARGSGRRPAFLRRRARLWPTWMSWRAERPTLRYSIKGSWPASVV